MENKSHDASQSTITLTDEQLAAKARAIDSFRTYLAARGNLSFMLSDDEVWKWIESLVESMNQHAAMYRRLQC